MLRSKTASRRDPSREELLSYACRIMARKAYTRSELAKKLQARSSEPETIDSVLHSLAESGYLNDLEYARQYLLSRQNSRPAGRRLVEMKLKARGVPLEIIRDVLSEVAPEEEEKQARELAEKKAVSLRKVDEATRCRRIYQFLLGRGFSPEIAARCARADTE